MYDVVIFRGELLSIGGIETWAINLAKRYGKTHKMAVVYGTGAYDTLRDISKHCEVIKYKEQKIKARTAVFCYDFMGFDTCEAKEKVHIIHADHSKIKLVRNIPDGIDRFLSVSDVARRGFIGLAGFDSEVVYNPVETGDKSRLIRLVSGTRLSEEKGLERMKSLAASLDGAGVLYEWQIFTNHHDRKPFSPNVIFREPTRRLLDYVRSADYLVQLSDTESYGYSIVESLSVGTPVVVTNIPVLPEIGVDKDNSIIVPLDGADYKSIAQDIATQKFKFSYEPPKDKWDDVFGEGSGNDYECKPLLLRNIHGGLVTLIQEGINLPDGETVTLYDKERADEIVSKGFLEYVN